MKRRARGYGFFIVAVIVLLGSLSINFALAAPEDMPQPRGHAMPLMPFLRYYLDETRGMDIEEAASPALAPSYKPLVLDRLPAAEGVTWLRFTISPLAADVRPATFLLDMGQSFPGTPILFSPERNELSGALEWRENKPAQRNILLLPEAGSEPVTCYIRLEGLPGPWFYPMVRTPQDAANNVAGLARTGAILALGVVMFLCFLRGLSENGQWRVWTAVYVGVALLQAWLGMPVISDKFNLSSLLATLAPGVALMLLPHVGRHLLDSPNRSKGVDRQLFLLSLPGAALALAPLVPGWDWLDRWLELWPALTLIFVPTALGAWLMGLGGSKRYLLGVLIPPIFTGLAYVGLEFGFPPNMLASGPLWGVALSALLIAATRSPREPLEEEASLPTAVSNTENGEVTIDLVHPLGDPNLRLLPAGDAKADAEPEAEKTAETAPPVSSDSGEDEARETAIRAVVDMLTRESAALSECELAPVAREHAESVVEATRMLAKILSAPYAEPTLPGERDSRVEPFNLQRLLREIHDSASDRAANSGVSLSWHMPAHLEQTYRGPARELKNVLLNLVESSIRSAPKGAVHISARHVPDSPQNDYLQFTVTDNGAGAPPEGRSGMAFLRAWELAARRGGYASLESGKHGAVVTFSLKLAAAKDESAPARESIPHVILACENDVTRAKLAAMLDDLPCRVTPAANAHEALVCQSVDPAPILITVGKLALPSAGDMAREFATLARQAGFSKCFILAVTADDTHWALLKPSGFTHAMTEPVDAETLRATVVNLNRQAGARARNEPAPSDDGNGDLTIADVGKKPKVTVEENEFELERPLEIPGWLAGEKPEDNEEETPGSSVSSPPAKTPQISPERTPPENVKTETGAEPADTVEWVGEPTPIRKEDGEEFPAKSSEIAPEAPKKPEQAEKEEDEEEIFLLTDYIVGTGESPAKPGPAKAEDERDLLDASLKLESAAFERTRESAEAERGRKNAVDDPVIRDLVEKLDSEINAATASLARSDSAGVADAAGNVANEADKHGLRLLARMASCVERAARADNIGALNDLLPELKLAVERNRLALTQKK